MATTTYGTAYVQNTDLVSGWPAASLTVANRIDAVSYAGNGVNAQTGTTYTLVLTDAGKNVTLSNASSVTVTIPASGSVNYATGTQIRFVNLGAGTVTIAAAGGVTLNGSPLTLSQYTDGTITKLATDTWVFTSAPVATSPGLVLVTPTSIANSGGSASASGGAVTFSGVSSVSLNGVFTSTYDNYRVHVTGTHSAGADCTFRLRVSGADNSTSNYQWRQNVTSTANTSYGANSSGGNDTQWRVTYMQTTDTSAGWHIYAPQLAKYTSFEGWGLGGGQDMGTFMGRFVATTQFDGLSFLCASGTLTGVIRVYGYKNS